METKTITEMDFSELFRFAEKEFGVEWNDANDLFFNANLKYGRINKINPLEAPLYMDYRFSGKASDIPKTDVDKMSEHDKAHCIFMVFAEKNGISGEVYINCS